MLGIELCWPRLRFLEGVVGEVRLSSSGQLCSYKLGFAFQEEALDLVSSLPRNLRAPQYLFMKTCFQLISYFTSVVYN